MSRVERVEHMLQAIEYETSLAFNENTVLLRKNQELEAENAKLRKLAKNLKACNGSCYRCIELFGSCAYEEEMQEL